MEIETDPSPARRRIDRILLAIFLAPFVLSLTYLFLPPFLPPVSSVMAQSFIANKGVERTWVPISRISPAMLTAVVAAEDGRFCEHYGIDWKAVDASMERNERGGRLHGASTITMQVAKNLFLWNGRNWLRKAIEAPIALWIDLIWPKRRILEVYLNIAQWGDGVFGVEEASMRAFHKHASELTSREAALLAAALPDPVDRNAARPNGYQLGLAGTIQARMAQAPDVAHCAMKPWSRF